MSPLVLQVLPLVSGKVHEVHQQVGRIFGTKIFGLTDILSFVISCHHLHTHTPTDKFLRVELSISKTPIITADARVYTAYAIRNNSLSSVSAGHHGT